ncbi:hypothetical protein PTSG_09223 [Salpingoeca rosetta]|uniref:Uncharacterized protein n=1 Tax=Salpingoeca rosetta (strain ATCC 50818 / BSB-021) TaxID=946362 RepID=F2UN29_SALR5|nr:uncharacterized protein PTSG_09223 [Salpingoeca rosetta]EGD78528.1 hypothetical protein PTSG_09223 [Salpingoeca rosetta]|eukprot:XP_004989477.1 hypothetical protein PTSG_09223 [Salpingoeca rosetta]
MTPGEPAEHRHEFHHHHNGREVEDDAVVAPSSPHCRGLMPSTRDLHEQDTDKKPSPAHATAQLTHASQQQQHQWLQQQQQHEPVQQQQEDEMQKGGGRGGRLRGSNTPSLVFPPNCTRKEAVPSKARKQPRVSRPAKSNKPTAIRREDPAIRQLILKCRERERQKQQQQEPQRAQQQRAGKHRATREATVNRQQHPAKRKQQVMRSGGSYSTTKDARGKQEQRYQQGAALTRTLTGLPCHSSTTGGWFTCTPLLVTSISRPHMAQTRRGGGMARKLGELSSGDDDSCARHELCSCQGTARCYQTA